MRPGDNSNVESSPARRQALAGFLPDYQNLNGRLRPKILSLANRVPDAITHRESGPSYFTNKWISRNRLHELEDPDFDTLVRHSEYLAARVLGLPPDRSALRIHHMWAMVSRPGMEGEIHNHKGLLSGAYYVDAGTSGTDGGEFQLYAREGDADPVEQIVPRSGQLILFPSAQFHAVNRYTGTSPRIVISLNIA